MIVSGNKPSSVALHQNHAIIVIEEVISVMLQTCMCCFEFKYVDVNIFEHCNVLEHKHSIVV